MTDCVQFDVEIKSHIDYRNPLTTVWIEGCLRQSCGLDTLRLGCRVVNDSPFRLHLREQYKCVCQLDSKAAVDVDLPFRDDR